MHFAAFYITKTQIKKHSNENVCLRRKVCTPCTASVSHWCQCVLLFAALQASRPHPWAKSQPELANCRLACFCMLRPVIAWVGHGDPRGVSSAAVNVGGPWWPTWCQYNSCECGWAMVTHVVSVQQLWMWVGHGDPRGVSTAAVNVSACNVNAHRRSKLH